VHLERGSARAHLRAVGKHANSNVFKILHLTTFRTIDLAGRKTSGPLFSRFWAETRVFLSLTAGSQPRSDLRRTRPIMMKRNTSSLRQLRSAASRNQLQAAENQRNSNVSKILPLTTFRTIDLAGRKNSIPLFSRFYAKREFFFDGNIAPQTVQLGAEAFAQLLRPRSILLSVLSIKA